MKITLTGEKVDCRIRKQRKTKQSKAYSKIRANLTLLRAKFIRDKISETSSVKVVDLAKDLDVTPETIRKDLTELEKSGFLRRIHGGAVNLDYFKSEESDFEARRSLELDCKRYLCENAARIIHPGDSLIIDNGSTCLEFTKIIKNIPKLTIITPSLTIASYLQQESTAEVFLLGGWLRKKEPAVVGEDTITLLQQFHVNKSILSCAGITVKDGLTEFHSGDAAIKRQAIESSEETIVLADHTKFFATSLVIVAPIEKIERVFTDNQLSEDMVKPFLEKGVDIIR